jgi:uncharacterized protein YgiM (DUF1202 family)
MKKFNLCSADSVVLAAVLLVAGQVRADSGGATMPVSAPAAGPSTRLVKGDHVNVRSRPVTTAEVIVQLRKGDQVEVQETKSVTEAGKAHEWVRIALPDKAKCYVSSPLVKDGVAASDSVNVRCGPGTNFKDVGQLKKGAKVAVVKTEGEWTQIKPTENCSGWVAGEYLETMMVLPPSRPIISTTEVVPPVAPPLPPQTIVETRTVEVEVHVDYVVRDGILQKVQGETEPPQPYELATEIVERRQYRIAYLDLGQLDVTKFEGKHVRIVGNQRWRRGDRYPVVVVERVDMVW